MAKLVDVMKENQILNRRQLPLVIDENLTVSMKPKEYANFSFPPSKDLKISHLVRNSFKKKVTSPIPFKFLGVTPSPRHSPFYFFT